VPGTSMVGSAKNWMKVSAFQVRPEPWSAAVK